MGKRPSSIARIASAMRAAREDAYALGVAARHAGALHNGCPYELQDELRTQWFAGWYSTDIQIRIGHIFIKYGISWS